jgi:hypothetical protein
VPIYSAYVRTNILPVRVQQYYKVVGCILRDLPTTTVTNCDRIAATAQRTRDKRTAVCRRLHADERDRITMLPLSIVTLCLCVVVVMLRPGDRGDQAAHEAGLHAGLDPVQVGLRVAPPIPAPVQ